MSHSVNRLFAILIALAISSLGWPEHVVWAASSGTPVLALSQQDEDNDGDPDLTIITTSFATEQDLIYVYDGNDDMLHGENWIGATDFLNDTWVFDARADDTVELVIQFAQESDCSVAYLYHDQDGDGRVAYTRLENGAQIDEPGSWELRVKSDGSWFLPDGFPNQNLDVFFSSDESVVSGVRDSKRDGIADYEFWTFIVPYAQSYDHRRASGVWVNEKESRPSLVSDRLFWPFLLVGGRPDVNRKFEVVPYVVMDWDLARIAGTSIGKDVSGYPIEDGYFILSQAPLQVGVDNYANFENPMAYYNLAADEDGDPELHIRHTYYGPQDRYFDLGEISSPFNDIRYSWNQRNSPGLYWDYKVGLAGANLVTTTVRLGDFGVQTVPYEQLPYWVASQEWGWGTFVVREEGRGSPSSEGIYEWPAGDRLLTDSSLPGGDPMRYTASQWLLRGYVTGRTSEPPAEYYSHIAPGLRGEFAYLNARRLSLYFSPVDSRLHLLWTGHGVWNIDGVAEIRYANRDGDPYLDEWRYFADGQLLRQLNLCNSHIVLNDLAGQVVALKQSSAVPSLFETLPPRDHEEWLALGQRLDTHQRDLGPGNFVAMLAQFDGPGTRIEGATLRDFRLMESGFRFILELDLGFHIVSDPEGWASGLDAPGAYAVSFDGTAWDVQPATPAAPRAGQLIVGEPLWAQDWTTLDVLLENDGLEDVTDLPVYAVLAGPAGQQALTATVALLPGEGSQRVTWDWAPPAAGTWQARVEVGGDGPRQVLLTADLQVAPRPIPSPGWLLSLGGRIPPVILAFLAGLALLAAGAGALWVAGLRWGRRP